MLSLDVPMWNRMVLDMKEECCVIVGGNVPPEDFISSLENEETIEIEMGKFPLGPIGKINVIIESMARKNLSERYYSLFGLTLQSCNGVSFRGRSEEDYFSVNGHYSFSNGGGGVMFLSKKDKKEK